MEPNNLNTKVIATPEPINAVLTPTQTLPVVSQSEVQYAGFGSRIGALLVDSVLVLAFIFIVSLLFGSVQSGSGSVGFSTSGIPGIVSNLLIIAYYIFFTGKYGQTLGKKVLKIKVVKSSDNSIPGFLNAFLREFVGKFLSASVLFLGYFWVIWDPKKQTWHDKIANTIVIKV